ncbi:HDOD domain-containing protein [Nitratiruptor sp. YY09-18]|uniref:HDOD domain-containing protein n=1 Tax=Nitratiruptor sp. YY09-18 TaxID=2724901 RepID=UPI001914E0CF|nr:HDOD domain-containing protein [Nitratiruptor sp. YY09-18]BCD68202.1 hypothetical protein NitYY0918_C1113 [Nitratiruptor sp. YY09-18]
MIEEILQQIEHLPPVPNVVRKLQDLYYLDAYNATDIEDIIMQDPNLVADILRIVNSPLYDFSREIVDIRQAIVLFGLEKIIEFALASFVDNLGAIDLSAYKINEQQFIRSAKQKSEITSSYVESKREKLLASNTAFLADVSKVIIANYVKEYEINLDIDPQMVFNEVDIQEKVALGFDTIEISALIFEKWNFDPHMIELLQTFKKRENPLQLALYNAREFTKLDGDIDKERMEEASKES